MGYVWGQQSSDRVQCWKTGIGLGSITLPIPLTYVGFSIIPKYELMFTVKPTRSFWLDLIFH
jgi:hypothetical protein